MLDVPRRCFALLAVNNWIYMFGGATAQCESTDDVQKINVLDGNTVKLSKIPLKMNVVRSCK